MPLSARAADRLALLGALAAVVVALAGASSLRERARPVDLITVAAGVLAATAALAYLVIRRRRTAKSRARAVSALDVPPPHTPPIVPWRVPPRDEAPPAG